MKRFASVIMFTVVLISLLSVNVYAETASKESILREYGELYDECGVEEINDALPDEVKLKLEEFSIDLNNPESISNFSVSNLLESLKDVLLSNIRPAFATFGILLAIAVLSAAVISVLPDNANRNAFGLLSVGVAALSVIMALVNIIQLTSDSILSCSIYMVSFVPLYAALLISSGYAAAANGYSVILFGAAQIFQQLAGSFIVPAGSILLAVSLASPFNKIGARLCEGIKKAIITILSISMTVLVSLIGLQSTISSATGTVGLKAAKSVISTFVPIVGSSLSEAFGAVLGSVSLLKCTVGAFSMICLALIIIAPLVRLLAMRAALGCGCALLETAGAEKAASFVKSAGSVVTILICTLLCISAVYIISIALTVSLGG